MSYLDAIAVLRVEGTIVEYTREDYDRVNDATRWIFDNLEVPAPIVVITSPEGNLVDVLVNGISIGYFACRLICLTLSKPTDAVTNGPQIQLMPNIMKQAQLVASGLAVDIDVNAILREHGCYIAPLFGETA
jgi:hypothetical protein